MSRQWTCGFVLLMALPLGALAADGDPFDPSGSLAHGTGGLLTESPTLESSGISAGLLANIAESLIVNEYSDGREEALLDNTLGLSLYGAYTYKDKFRVDVFVPGYGYVDAPGNDFSGPAFGDLRVQGLIPILADSETFGLSILPRVTLPTGTRAALLRRGASVGFALVLGGETSVGLGWAANVGATLSGTDSIGDVDIGSDVEAKAGLWYHVDDAFRVGLEGQGLVGLARGTDQLRHSLFTTNVFAQVTSAQGIGMTVGLGTGAGVGAPEYRLFAALTYAPLFPDSDDDGYRDSEDGCPSAAEDFDGFEDEDGCPDGDNDDDGLLDLADGCPDDAEDMDDWMDDDGCPEPDNDEDGVLDVNDVCPNNAGDPAMMGCPDSDHDGVADREDACPQLPGPVELGGCPDRDGDKVPDNRDECPDEPIPEDAVPETSNGCPSRAYVVEGAIRITERVNFDTGRATIRLDSYGLLDDVAAIIIDNPSATEIEVAGHTDDRGNERTNLTLSQARAESVLAYLTGKGVAASRLSAKGYGQERPIDTNRTVAGRGNNRRVEFTIEASTPVPAPIVPTVMERPEPEPVPVVEEPVEERLEEPVVVPEPIVVPAALQEPVAEEPAPTAMERPSPGDSPWTQPAEEETVEPEPEAEPEPEEDIVIPEGLDTEEEAGGPSDDLEETLRRGGNPWGPR